MIFLYMVKHIMRIYDTATSTVCTFHLRNCRLIFTVEHSSQSEDDDEPELEDNSSESDESEESNSFSLFS